ncbi:hypothetical protein ABNF97_23855 [Plantactinospora sp. B6F1]|uniref:hypothetical protein n=1 Tax=Plantactinospora sp. B6F1 TaxID=3158971 RepID=UPI0032D97CC6
MKTVALVELATFANIVTLAPGCLWAYAREVPEIVDNVELRLYDGPVIADRQQILADLVAHENRERFGITVRRVPNPAAEADVVVATKWVTEEQYRRGRGLLLRGPRPTSLRGFDDLANYLDRTEAMSFDGLFRRGRTVPRPSPGGLADQPVLRRLGPRPGQLLSAQQRRHLPEHAAARRAGRPCVHRAAGRATAGRFTAPPAAVAALADMDSVPLSGNGPLLRHPYRRKMPFHAGQPLQDNIAYCDGMTTRIRSILAEWTAVPATIGA